MRLRLTVLLCLTAVTASTDLLVKLAVHANPDYAHRRSALWAAVSIALLVLLPLLARVPSRLLVVAVGFHTGGTLGNLVSAYMHRGFVPNPLVLYIGRGGIAFNPADVFVLIGIVLLMAAAVEFTFKHRDALPQSFVAVRLYRRLAEKQP